MIRLGLRLAVTGGREAAARLALIAAAVAIGVGMLLLTLAAANAVSAQNLRYSWLNSGVTSAATGPEAADPLWWSARTDRFRGRALGRVDLAATGPASPVPPGLPRLPAAGEFYASPALAELLATTPADQLGDRFPGRPAGVLGAAAVPSPDSLLIVVGRTPAEVSRIGYAKQITRFVSVSPSECDGCYIGIGSDAFRLVLGVVGAALLFPLLMFIGTATRLSAARREQRFAAMRLIGATPRQIATLATAESAVAALAGTLAGFLLYLALRPAAAGIPFTGERFFPGDLTLSLANVLAVAAGVPLGAAVSARFALRRVRISPLGVTRRVTPKPPRAWRLVLLAAGLGELAWFVGRRPGSTDGQLTAYLSGILLAMVGLVVAGPYLTLLGSRLLAGRARRPATLIAGRRLADDPRAGFRAVSGLTLALFVASVGTGIITTMVAEEGAGSLTAAQRGNLDVAMNGDDDPIDTTVTVPAGLAALPGVQGVQIVRFDPRAGDGVINGLISCADLARTPSLEPCPAGIEVARRIPDLVIPDFDDDQPPAGYSAADLDRLPVLSVVAVTDGATDTVERARTMLLAAYPNGRAPFTGAEWSADLTRDLVQIQRLADVVIVASLVIAGCSLAVGVVGGLNERRRPFSLLRLAGVRLPELRRVVALESAVPLLAVSVLAVGAGLLAAHLFLRAQLGYSLHPPGAGYYVIVVTGLAASLGLIASTMPLLRRITGPETARNE